MNPNNVNVAMTGEAVDNSPEKIFDNLMVELEYLEKAQAQDPQNKRIGRYMKLTECLAKKVLAEVGGDEKEIREAERNLGATARVVAGSEITSPEFADQDEPAVDRFDRDGMKLLKNEERSDPYIR